MAAPPKYRRLLEMRGRLPHVSQRALQAICDDIDRNGLPDAYSRDDMRAARDWMLDTPTGYGTIIKQLNLVGKDSPTLDILNLWAFLDVAYRGGGSFRQLVSRRHSEQPSSEDKPWRLMLYCDEIVPGIQIGHVDRRKVWAFYASILEFGPLTLSNIDAWITLTCAQSMRVHERVDAGIAQIWKGILRTYFLGPESPTVLGIVLGDLNDGGVCIHFKVGGFIMDGAAHAATWSCKGDAALKPCMECINFFARKSDMTDEHGDNMLVCSNVRERDLVLHTDDTIRAAYDRLRQAHDARSRGELSDDAVTYQEKVSGFRFEPSGLMNDMDLREIVLPITHKFDDPQHCLWVNGVFGTLAYCCLESTYMRHKNIYKALDLHIQSWILPCMVQGSALNIKCLFNNRRVESHRAAKHLKCSGGEAIGSFLLIKAFFREHVAPDFPAVRLAWDAFCDMAELFIESPFSAIDPPALKKAVRKFLKAFRDAGFEEYEHPKFHWLLKFGRQLARMLWLLACWELERKHKQPKALAALKHSMVLYDASLLRDLTVQSLTRFSEQATFSVDVDLMSPGPATGAVKRFINDRCHDPLPDARVLQAVRARYSYRGWCAKGDIVILDAERLVAAEVYLHVAADHDRITIVSLWGPPERVDADKFSGTWIKRRNLDIVPLTSILGVCTAKWSHDTNSVLLILPFHLRR